MGQPYREKFLQAMTLLGRANQDASVKAHGLPVIVGGAAVEFFTSGAFDTGDFDLVTAWQ